MFEAMKLDESLDLSIVEWLGNTGSVALPTAMALGIERETLSANDRVALFGIGSGVNCVMLGVEWQKSLAPSRSETRNSAAAAAGH